jgi:hypothetical protein
MKVELEIPDEILGFLKDLYGEETIKQDLEYSIIEDFRSKLVSDLGESLMKFMLKKHRLDKVSQLMEDAEFRKMIK